MAIGPTRIGSPDGREAKRMKMDREEEQDYAGEGNEEVGQEQEVFGCNTPACLQKFTSLSALREHVRTAAGGNGHSVHDERPYRCALCDRTYKNANGLKYHVSTSITDGKHTHAAPTRGRPSKGEEQNTAAAPRQVLTGEEVRECFPCPLDGCTKRYKQLSGLRYHLVRGHEKPLGYAELAAINPALAERLNGRGDALEKAREKTKSNRKLSSTSEVDFNDRENEEDDGTSNQDDRLAMAAHILAHYQHPAVFEDEDEEPDHHGERAKAVYVHDRR